MSVISNFIVISLFLNELSSNLALELKISSLFIYIYTYIYSSKTNFSLLFATNEKTWTQILVIF